MDIETAKKSASLLKEIDELEQLRNEFESGKWTSVIAEAGDNTPEYEIMLSDALGRHLLSCAQTYIADEILRKQKEIEAL